MKLLLIPIAVVGALSLSAVSAAGTPVRDAQPPALPGS
jgi:hypothetical protein